MKLLTLLNELLNEIGNVYEFHYTNNEFDNEYIFNAKNRQYSVYFIKHRNTEGVYERSFRPTMSHDELNNYRDHFVKYLTPRESYNDFDTLKVYRTVTKITEDFINKKDVSCIYISPLDDKRKNIVRMFINKIELPIGWKIFENVLGNFFIIKEDYLKSIVDKMSRRRRVNKDIDITKLTTKDFVI